VVPSVKEVKEVKEVKRVKSERVVVSRAAAVE
jgi:hypothetical protein